MLASGRTPGKRLNGLRVVRESGGPVTFLASAIRNMLRLIDFLPGVISSASSSILVTARNQRLGDLAAGTLVVRERKALPPEPVLRPYAAGDDAPAWDTSAIGADELTAVRASSRGGTRSPPMPAPSSRRSSHRGCGRRSAGRSATGIHFKVKSRDFH